MFKYLFYKIFSFQHKIIGEEKLMAALSAVFTISFLFAMNIITIYHYLNKQTYIISDFTSRFNSYCGTNLATPIAFATVILVPVLFIFFFKVPFLEGFPRSILVIDFFVSVLTFCFVKKHSCSIPISSLSNFENSFIF